MKTPEFLGDKVGTWTAMNLVEKGNLKMSLCSTLCKTQNTITRKIMEGGASGDGGMAEASPAPWETSLALRQE